MADFNSGSCLCHDGREFDWKIDITLFFRVYTQFSCRTQLVSLA